MTERFAGQAAAGGLLEMDTVHGPDSRCCKACTSRLCIRAVVPMSCCCCTGGAAWTRTSSCSLPTGEGETERFMQCTPMMRDCVASAWRMEGATTVQTATSPWATRSPATPRYAPDRPAGSCRGRRRCTATQAATLTCAAAWLPTCESCRWGGAAPSPDMPWRKG